MPKVPPLPFVAINGGLDWAILIGKRPAYTFQDGKRISETPDKIRYDVVLPGNCFAPLTVSIPGSIDTLSAISDEQIAEGCATLRPLLVRFSEATVRIYSINGEQKMTAAASSIELVKPSK